MKINDFNIRYMCKLALGSRNNENSVLTFFQTHISNIHQRVDTSPIYN